ncbi:MAG: Gldg family protein, partial [Chloroflexota bacterium]|nr:Gldg family protein [Chloroflexota bacterium]
MASGLPRTGGPLGRVGSFFGVFGLVALFLGVLSFVAAGLVYLFLPDLRASLWTLLALGGLFILLFLWGAFNQIRVAILGRRGKYGTNTVVMVLVFVGILVLLNFIAMQNRQRFDVTALGHFTLTPQTVRVLKELNAPVKVTAFFVPGDPSGDKASSLLTEYTFQTQLFTFGFVDPEANPGMARQYNIKSYGAMVFESGTNRRSVFDVDEQVFSGAILEVAGVKQKKIYFLTGHDERDLALTTGDGYSQVREGLIKDLYQVGIWNLAVKPE